MTRDEALAHETSGVDSDRCTYPTQSCAWPIAASDAKESSISGAARAIPLGDRRRPSVVLVDDPEESFVFTGHHSPPIASGKSESIELKSP